MEDERGLRVPSARPEVLVELAGLPAWELIVRTWNYAIGRAVE